MGSNQNTFRGESTLLAAQFKGVEENMALKKSKFRRTPVDPESWLTAVEYKDN